LLAVLGGVQIGCAELPPLPVDRTMPRVAVTPTPTGFGQIVVDVEGPKHARLDELVGHAKVESTTALPLLVGDVWMVLPYTTTKNVAITRERCSALPCAVNAPMGETELTVRSGDESQAFRVSAGAERTFVRVRLPEHQRPALGVLGCVLAGVSLAPLATGASMLAADSPGLLAPGLGTLGGGLLVALAGLVLVATHPMTSRPGSLVAWTIP